MSPSTALNRIDRYAVPVVLFAIVAGVVLAVPPVVLGEATTRTYAITAALLIIAFGSVMPYALLVAVGTLPLLYRGVASYAAPMPSAGAHHVFSLDAVFRHLVAGIAYTLGAAAVGTIGIGAQIGGVDMADGLPAVVQPALLILGGVLVAGVFVWLQLWRYDPPVRSLDRWTILGTAVLGLLLALAPVVAYWVFRTVPP